MPEYILRYSWILKCFFPVLTLAPNQHPSPQTPPLPKKHCSPGSFLRETHALALQLQRDLWRRFSSRAQFATVWRSRGTPEKTPQRVGAFINNPKTVGWFRKSWLTNQLSPGVNLPIFSYIFHVEQGFVHDFWTINCMKGSPLPGMQWSQSGCLDLWVLSLHFSTITGKGGGPTQTMPKKASIAQNGDLKPSRSKQNQQPNKRKEAKRSQTSPTRKPFPIPSLPWNDSPSQPKLRKATSAFFRST